jgi:hypothetical protein
VLKSDTPSYIRNPEIAEGEMMTDYIASEPTDNPADLLRDKDIAIGFLLRECKRLEREVDDREATIQELMIDLA